MTESTVASDRKSPAKPTATAADQLDALEPDPIDPAVVHADAVEVIAAALAFREPTLARTTKAANLIAVRAVDALLKSGRFTFGPAQ